MTDSTTAGAGNGLHGNSASELKGQAQEKAQEAAGEAKGRARRLVDERSTQVGEQISTQAGDLRSVGEQLRAQGKDQPAELADKAAERVESFGGYLSRADADTLLDDVEDFGRKNPWALALGGVALGFAASRLLKASSTQRYETRGSAGAAAGGTTTSYDPPALPRQSTDGASVPVGAA
jgi:hypothetical protein